MDSEAPYLNINSKLWDLLEQIPPWSLNCHLQTSGFAKHGFAGLAANANNHVDSCELNYILQVLENAPPT
jgi:hypothetical protein